MKLIKCIAILPLCLLIGSCPDNDFYMNIGKFEYHLEAWNKLNITDYKLYLELTGNRVERRSAVVYVRNGIPENSNPPDWIAKGEMSTVMEFFNLIKNEEEKITNDMILKNGGFLVNYDRKFYAPRSISYCSDANPGTLPSYLCDWNWEIRLTPLAENEQEAWNRLNISDYQLSIELALEDKKEEQAVVIVRNGVPVSSEPPEWLERGGKSTVEDFFAFVRDEEKKSYNEIKYLYVEYSDYHHPKLITTAERYWYYIGRDKYMWNISLTPLPPEETEGEEK